LRYTTHSAEIPKKSNAVIDEIANDVLPEIKKLIIGNVSDGDLKWLIVTKTADMLPHVNINMMNTFRRKDGSNWGFMGLEQHNLIDENTGTQQNGNCNDIVEFWRYSYNTQNIGLPVKQLGLNHAPLFSDIVKNKRNVNSFSESEKELWKVMDGWYAHADKDGNVIFDVPVFTTEADNKVREIIKSHPKYNKLQESSNSLCAEVKEILKRYSNPVINDTLDYYVAMFMFDIRGMFINDEVEANRLIVPEDKEKSIIGMYVNVK